MATFAILKFVEFVIEGYLILVLITISVIISDGSNDKNHRQLMAEEELNKHPELIVKSGLYYDKEFNSSQAQKFNDIGRVKVKKNDDFL